MVFPAGRASTSFRIDLARPLAAVLSLLAVGLTDVAAFAQPTATSPELEELIPDSAISDPESWANQNNPDNAPAEDAPIEAQSPLADIPDMSLPWPDEAGVPELAPLTPETDIQFAEDPLGGRRSPRDVDRVRVSSRVTLIFPADVKEMPEREEFAQRFDELSTIEDLSDDGGNIAQIAVRARADEELLESLLRNYGYYDGQVIRSVRATGGAADSEEGQQTSENTRVRFDILPGPQYHFGEIDLGLLTTAPDAETLRKAFEIWPQDPVLADKIVSERYDLDTALGETGYPFASIEDPSLLVDHARREGDLTMMVKPAGKYNFGQVVSKNPRFLSSKHLSRIARFDPGDTYKRSLEMDLRRAILATGLVSTLTITPRETRPPTATESGEVQMDVDLTKAPLRTIAGAIGYGTGEGVRVEASWEHRNFFPPEGALRVRGIAGTREQLLGVTFRRNNWLGRDRVLTLDAYATTVDRDAYEARTASLIASFEKVSTIFYQKRFTWRVGVELVATDEREGNLKSLENPRNLYWIAAVPLQAQIDTSDDLLDPTKGFRIGGRLSPEISWSDGAKSTYLRSQVDLSAYQKMSDKIVLAGRARVGSIVGTGTDNIAPSRRMYSGGGGSVRGYGYQKIGPLNNVGEPKGGRSLVEFSLEARVNTGLFGGALQVVPFVDAGSVGADSTPGFSDLRFGAGVGVRYKTSFGPIRVDVGTPLNRRKGDSIIGVYVGLGQAF